MLISVITLTYNNWRLIHKAIDSLKEQSLSDDLTVEYIIADDGTSDFDFDYVDSLLSNSNLNYKIIVNSENIGTVASFNNAIKNSSGELIIPLSADDVFYDSKVLVDIVNEFRFGWDVITALRKDYDTECIYPTKRQLSSFASSEALLKHLKYEGNIISGASTYYSRAIFERLGYFDSGYRLLEDYPYYLKLLENGCPIKLLERITIRFGSGGVSDKKNVNPILLKDYARLKRDMLNNTSDFFSYRLMRFNLMTSWKEKILLSLPYPEQSIIKLIKIFRNK